MQENVETIFNVHLLNRLPRLGRMHQVASDLILSPDCNNGISIFTDSALVLCVGADHACRH